MKFHGKLMTTFIIEGITHLSAGKITLPFWKKLWIKRITKKESNLPMQKIA